MTGRHFQVLCIEALNLFIFPFFLNFVSVTSKKQDAVNILSLEIWVKRKLGLIHNKRWLHFCVLKIYVMIDSILNLSKVSYN